MGRLLIILAFIVSVTGICAAEPIYISDAPDLIVFKQQTWGALGLGTMAYQQGEKIWDMQIKDKAYKKGLGTHATSEIIIDLRGAYLEFQAEVGVQHYDPPMGSVVFQAFVDGKKAFDSGLMKVVDAARPVKISLAGADELKLVVTDGGDGISCDMANWADARLTPGPTARERGFDGSVDVGQFAQVLSWDPDRKDGTKAGRTQEFPAEDLFRETELVPDAQNLFAVPADGKGVGSIGLQWLEPRHVQRIGIEFAGANASTSADGLAVEYWSAVMERGATSGSRWQGAWKPLKGAMGRDGNRFVYDVDWKGSEDKTYGTTKVRWIVPASLAQIKVKRPTVLTDSPWATTDVVLQVENPQPGANAQVACYNSEIVTDSGSATSTDWDLSQPLKLKVRYGVPKRWMYDRSSLRITLPNGGFGIAIDDLLKNKSIYVKDFGFFATLASSNQSVAQYKNVTSGLNTVLERVNEMPDQTLHRAIETMHRHDGDVGPTMLSLACDNHKFILHRSGLLIFDKTENPWATGGGPHMQLHLARAFGSNQGQTTRGMDGWMPIVNIQTVDGGVLYREKCYVAPIGDPPASAGALEWLNQKPLYVSEYEIENPTDQPLLASARFQGSYQVTPVKVITPEVTGDSARYTLDGNLIAWVAAQDGGLKIVPDGDCMKVTGTLPAKSKAHFSVYVPQWVVQAGDVPAVPQNTELLAKTKAYWNDVMARSMQVDIPDKYLADVIKANQVHCLMAGRSEEDKRVAAWIASASYGPLESEAHSVIRGMMYTGNMDFAKRSLEFFIKRYNDQGFLTTGYTFLGTGWHLWALGEYYSLTQDKEWMKSIAPDVARVCKWAMAQREKTKKLDAQGAKVPEWGLMPPGVLADWSVYAYYFYMNGNFSAGLKSAGAALADIGYPDADKIIQSGEELATETVRAYRRVQALAPVVPLKDGNWVPATPTQAYSIWPTNQMYPGSDSGRSWCYDVELGAGHLVPMGVVPAQSREAGWMMDYMEDVQFLSEGWFYYPADLSEKDWFNRGGFAKVQPYYARTVETYAAQDRVKPFVRSYINSLVSLLNREDLSLWEHFVNGAFNKTHETGYFLYQSSVMLATERGDDLWIAPFVTSNWMKNGMTVGAKLIPSKFGSINYRINSHANQGYIEAVVATPTRQAPKVMVVRLRHPDGKKIKSVTVNGQAHTDFDAANDTVRVASPSGNVVVKAEY